MMKLSYAKQDLTLKELIKKLWLLIQAINQIHRKADLWLAALKTYYKKKLLTI